MEDYSTLSDEELLAAYNEAKHLKTVYDVSQLVKKILLNSYYGATGSHFFRFYDIRLAQATTLSGQNLIRTIAKNISDFVSNVVSEKTTEENQWIVAGDTDSVVSDTMIYVNDKKIAIGDYYNSLPDDFIKKDDKNQNYVKRITSDNTYSVQDNTIVSTGMRYIMKHRVKKRMYSLRVQDKTVIITEDHSLIVKRDGKLIECKPVDTQKGDKILKISK